MNSPWIKGPRTSPVASITGGSITGQTGTPYILAQSGTVATTPADTNENTLATITIPAGVLGASGRIELQAIWSVTSSGNAKTFRIRFSGAAGTQALSKSVTAVSGATSKTIIQNRNSVSAQYLVTEGMDSAGVTFGTTASSSEDTSAATTIVITGQKASAGETLNLIGYSAIIYRP
jgi:hypothetical protein